MGAEMPAVLDWGFATYALVLLIGQSTWREVGTECHPYEEAERPTDEKHEECNQTSILASRFRV